jgi:hypothetical protein
MLGHDLPIHRKSAFHAWHDLGVFTLNPLQTEDIFWVQNMVLDRRRAEIPLTKVRLPHAILPFFPLGLSCLDRLRENVEVEVLGEDEDVIVIEYEYHVSFDF